MSNSKEKLRLVTYLSPGIPVEIFETLMNYLEEVTGRDAYLRYESRWPGPPADRTDPFTDNEVDIGKINCYLVFLKEGPLGREFSPSPLCLFVFMPPKGGILKLNRPSVCLPSVIQALYI
jgi:hypothetical protein